MSIVWIGESEHWKPARISGGEWMMPLIEETVLNVAESTSFCKKLSVSAAINCTSRIALRVALASTNLNPEWHPINWQAGVIKAPASCLNLGVRFLPSNEYVERLAAAAPALARIGVNESFVGGTAWELDGWIKDGKIGFFHPLRQIWNEGNTKIEQYQRGEPRLSNLRDAVCRALTCIGLDNSAFCVELRETPDDWKIIECHARLGEDFGLSSKMCDSDPLRFIEEAI